MDELGKSIPLAEGMVDAEQGATKNTNTHCLNCGTELIDRFCHHCGQKDIPKRQTLGELLTNFLSSFWSFEGKFFRTTRYLISKPGLLAKDYNAGKRESYYHPARMYVFLSFVFFLVVLSLPDGDGDDNIATVKATRDNLSQLKEDYEGVNLDSLFRIAPREPGDTSARVLLKNVLDSLQRVKAKEPANLSSDNGSISLTTDNYETLREYDSVQNALPPDKRDNWLERRMLTRGLKLKERYGKDEAAFGDAFTDAFLRNFSKVLFWLLPVFALLLKLLYWRRDFFYSEHLVFTIYYYNFFYLAGTAMALLGLTPIADVVNVAIGFWVFFYLLFAMKRMYNQRWPKTITKFLLFCFVFVICLGIGLTINALAIFLTL